MLTKAEKKYISESKLIEKLAQPNSISPKDKEWCTYIDQKGIQRVRPCDSNEKWDTYIDEKGIERVRKPKATTPSKNNQPKQPSNYNEKWYTYVDEKGIQRVRRPNAPTPPPPAKITNPQLKSTVTKAPKPQLKSTVRPIPKPLNKKQSSYIKNLEFHSNKFIKTAGLFEDLDFPGVASSLIDYVKNIISPDDQSPLGLLKGLGNVVATGALFKVHPVLGITYTVAQMFGIDVIGIAKSIISSLINKVQGGSSLSMDDISVSANKYDSIIKQAKFGIGDLEIPFLGDKNQPLITRVFGNLWKAGKQRQFGTLIVGIVIWTIKTSLLGLGLLGAGSLVTGLGKKIKEKIVGPKEESREEPKPEHEEEIEETKLVPGFLNSERNKAPIRPTGKGEKYFVNDSSTLWIVPLRNNDIEDTLVTWTNEIYPNIKNVQTLPSFHSTVRLLEKNYNKNNPGSLVVPQGFHTRKQIVDLFAKDYK